VAVAEEKASVRRTIVNMALKVDLGNLLGIALPFGYPLVN
jgi:hypothetical protein